MSNNQRGAVLPIVIIILIIAGILVTTKLVSVPQIFKPKAYGGPVYPNGEICKTICEKIPDIQTCGGLEGKLCPVGMTCITPGKYPDAQGVCIPLPPDIPPPLTTTASCDKDNMATFKWQPVKRATNYTLRINKEPEEWNPDYSEYDADRATIGSGDRALEAGNITSATVNVGAGFFVGGTVTASDGSVQVLPPFSCPGKVDDRCAQEKATWACSSSNEVNCKFFPQPCNIPPDWKPISTPAPTPSSTSLPYSTP